MKQKQKGQKGPVLEYVKVVPKFVQDIKNRISKAHEINDKREKAQISQMEDDFNKSQQYDLENAQILGDEEIVQLMQQKLIEEKKRQEFKEFKPTFQSKKQQNEDKIEQKVDVTRSLEEQNKIIDIGEKKLDQQNYRNSKNRKIVQDQHYNIEHPKEKEKKKVKLQSILSFNPEDG